MRIFSIEGTPISYIFIFFLSNFFFAFLYCYSILPPPNLLAKRIEE
nr:MAG TPA: hypothetical protein [Caudoviricetes sp.]